MNRLSPLLALALLLGLSCAESRALVSRSAGTVDHQFLNADAVVRAVVMNREPIRNAQGQCQTRCTLQIEETLKGRVPARVSILLPGEMAGPIPVSDGCQPALRIGERRLFFLKRGRGGHLHLPAGPASALKLPEDSPDLAKARLLSVVSMETGEDLTDQAVFTPPLFASQDAAQTTATNLLLDPVLGLPPRFVAPDRGDPIPYLVDADLLPPGISLSQALTAVSNALAAWKAVAPLNFEFLGVQSFGNSAKYVNASDGILRIQLHDYYGAIPSTDTLGIGGSGYYTNILSPGWTTGGQVLGNDFHLSVRGYVVLNDWSDGLTNLLTFQEVLCHEVGHALGMAHSTPDSPAPLHSPAWEAQMYYIAHEDGRGAAPTPWDTNVLQQIHPSANTPPFMYARVMEIVTATPQPTVPGINQLQLKGYDLQTGTLTTQTADPSSLNGSWSINGTNLSYLANAPYETGPGFDPSDSSYRDIIYARCSDGVHRSPYVNIRVLGYRHDTSPATSDGIPDYWMINYFGSENGAAAAGDTDADRLSNLQEYRTGMNPTNAASAQRLSAAADGTVSWQGKAYELYELHGSTNLTHWFFVKAVLPTNDTPYVKVKPSSYGSIVYRAFKVP